MQAATADALIPILMVDDDVKLCRLIGDYLEPLGYRVTSAYSGPRGVEMALGSSFAALILDVMLPGMDGLAVLRQIRKSSSVPVLMLTGRGDVPDRIVGLEMGADDYLPKTSSTRELLARLRSIIRRSSAAPAGHAAQSPPVVVGDLRLDRESWQATLSGQSLQFTSVEFDLLLSLAKAAGRVKTREQLLSEVADRHFDISDRSIDVHISSIRKKLGDDPRCPRFITTIRGAGYLLRKPASDAQ